MEIGCTDYCGKWRLEKEITLDYGDWGTDYCGKWRLEKEFTLDYGDWRTDYCGCCSWRTHERATKKS
jgi:hypothetical protein